MTYRKYHFIIIDIGKLYIKKQFQYRETENKGGECRLIRFKNQ